MSWPSVRLSEVCELRYGKSLPQNLRQVGCTPVFGSNGIVGSHSDSITNGPTIIVGRKGSFGEVNFSEAACWPIDTTYYIDSSSTDADLKWLYYLLRTLGLNRMNRAAAVPGLNREDAYRKDVRLPPLDEQRRIAGILDLAEELRAKRRAAIALLDQLPQAIFQEMFGDFESMEKSYNPVLLSELLAEPMRSGAYFPKDFYTSAGGVEMVHMSDAFYEVVTRGSLKRVSASRPDVSKYALLSTDLLIARRSLNFEGAAKACRIPCSEDELIFESSLIRLRPDQCKVDTEFLFQFINHPQIRRRKIEPLITRATISGINQSNLSSVTIPLPPPDLQRQFASLVEAVRRAKFARQTALTELDTLFASLQHRAFSGD